MVMSEQGFKEGIRVHQIDKRVFCMIFLERKVWEMWRIKDKATRGIGREQ